MIFLAGFGHRDAEPGPNAGTAWKDRVAYRFGEARGTAGPIGCGHDFLENPFDTRDTGHATLQRSVNMYCHSKMSYIIDTRKGIREGSV
jgi:hypothetical protein